VLIERVRSPRRVTIACLIWFGLLFPSLFGLVESSRAQDTGPSIVPRAINLGPLVADGRVKETGRPLGPIMACRP
jgi:hypothetical protein